MNKLFLVVILLGGAVFGGYYLLKPKPAFDIGKFKATIEEVEKRAGPALNQPVDLSRVPELTVVLVNYFDGIVATIERNPVCSDAEAALARFDQEMQSRLQNAVQRLNEQMRSGAANNASMNAQFQQGAIAMFQSMKRSLPAIEDFCRRCPKESGVLNGALSRTGATGNMR